MHNPATGSRPPSLGDGQFQYRTPDGKSLPPEEAHRLWLMSQSVEPEEPQPAYRDMLVHDIELRQAVEAGQVAANKDDPGENHRRLVEDIEALQALDSGQVHAPVLSDILSRGAVHAAASNGSKVGWRFDLTPGQAPKR